jgi:hypothetical protein
MALARSNLVYWARRHRDLEPLMIHLIDFAARTSLFAA